MRSSVFALMIASGFLFLSSNPSLSRTNMTNEPTTFRNIPFGADLSEITGTVLVKKEAFFDFYKRKNEKLSIGSADIKTIYYGFFHNKLGTVKITFQGLTNFSLLEDTLIQEYGHGFKPQQYIDYYLWIGTKVDIGLEYNSISGSGTIWYFYKPITDEEARYRKEKSKAGASDL